MQLFSSSLFRQSGFPSQTHTSGIQSPEDGHLYSLDSHSGAGERKNKNGNVAEHLITFSITQTHIEGYLQLVPENDERLKGFCHPVGLIFW